jgi:hypothetical protein
MGTYTAEIKDFIGVPPTLLFINSFIDKNLI